jgi:putative DNA primase/helicase
MSEHVVIEHFDCSDTPAGVSGVSGVQASTGAGSARYTTESAGVSGVSGAAPQVPSEEDRPCYRVFTDWWTDTEDKRQRPGVWHFFMKNVGTPKTPIVRPAQTWVCDPLHVEAVLSDAREGNFGRLLRFQNTLGRWNTWAMPMRLLAGRGDELRGELLASGLRINPAAQNHLAMYLQSETPQRRVTCALSIGWHGKNFVLPDATIGPTPDAAVFQAEEVAEHAFTQKGTLTGWRDSVATLAHDNPMLVLALATAFAGPLLSKVHAEGGGVHLVGESSTGKTSCLDAARSVWGGPEFRRSWRSTANGMEGAAALSNDCLLPLDEISECDPREIGLIAYALTNGTGKQRATRTGAARTVRHWRCCILSTGEKTLATAMLEGGQRAKAGQAVRLLDVPVARQYGAWDALHGHADGRAFSDALKTAAAEHYGTAGRAFLERLTHDGRDFGQALEAVKSLPEFNPPGAQGQVKRAAARLALIALAGELAIEYGLTPWPQGHAIEACGLALKLWHEARGGTVENDERGKVLGAVGAFLDRYGAARFQSLDAPEDARPIPDRAGWRESTGDGVRYLFTASGLAEAAKGFDTKLVTDVLASVGALPAPGADGKRSVFRRIDGRGVRVYVIDPAKLVEGEQ